MLTKLYVKNFKRFYEESIELGNPVVFIGPNDSGKTSALQALALWELGLRRWNEKRKGKPAPEKRPGVTINRKDLVFIPVRDAIQIWRNLAVRNVYRTPQGQRTIDSCINNVLYFGQEVSHETFRKPKNIGTTKVPCYWPF